MRIKTFKRLIKFLKICSVIALLLTLSYVIIEENQTKCLVISLSSSILILVLGLIRHKMITFVLEKNSSSNWKGVLDKMESKGNKYI